MSTDAVWFESVERDARRYAVVFLHLGWAFGPYREHLASAGGETIRAMEYLDRSESAEEDSLVIVTDVQECVTTRRLSLSALRAKVLDDIDQRGHKIVLVSDIARAAYPTVVGSDLLANAKHVFALPLSVAEGDDPLSALPGWVGSEASKETFLATCVSELSAETVVNLGELIWDLGLSPNECLDSLTALDKESLRGAGLLKMHDEAMSWLAAGEWKAFRAAVAVASSRYMTTADWLSQVFVDLWLIERQVRNAMRDAMMKNHGAAWRSACASPDMSVELVARARKDVQPRAERIEDLRDPLEWLTTSELLDLRETRELGELGLESYLWTKLRGDLLPIRNRAAHMRVISERDARTVATWRKLVMSKLCVTHGV